MRKLIETAGRLVANKNAPDSGVTAPYGSVDDMGRVQLSQDVMTKRATNGNATNGELKSPRQEDTKDAGEESVTGNGCAKE